MMIADHWGRGRGKKDDLIKTRRMQETKCIRNPIPRSNISERDDGDDQLTGDAAAASAAATRSLDRVQSSEKTM
jgi:hypothetical protein